MDRAEKAETVDRLHAAFSEAPAVFLTHYTGLTVAQMERLRIKLRDAGAWYKVTKNTLAKLAVQDTPYSGLSDMLEGPTGITFSSDPVQAAKAVRDYAKDHEKFTIVGGGLGAQILDAAAVEELSKMPSIEELRAKLLGVLNAPATKLVGTLQAGPRDFLGQLNAPANNLVGVLSAYQHKEAA